jgi:hypothetical protein
MAFSRLARILNGDIRKDYQPTTPSPTNLQPVRQPRLGVIQGATLAPTPPRVYRPTPVRELTESEARDIAYGLWEKSEFSFVNQASQGWVFPPVVKMTKDKDGKVNWGGPLHLRNTIGGVPFVNVSDPERKPVVYGCGWRMLVLAHRMAKFILAEFGEPAIIYHNGFAGRGDIHTNRHNRGVAFDFSGARTGLGEFHVLQDWGDMVVPDSLGGVNGKWPSTLQFKEPRFRLSETSPGKPYAYDFFLKLYNFAIRECRDGSTKVPGLEGKLHPPAADGFVIHPDYGKHGADDGRADHNNHIHMDVAEEFS